MSRFAVLVALLLGSIISSSPVGAQVPTVSTSAIRAATHSLGSLDRCESELVTVDDPTMFAVGAGALAVYSFMNLDEATQSGDVSADDASLGVRVTVVEADAPVELTSAGGKVVARLLEGPSELRLRWEFLDPYSGSPVEIASLVTIDGLDLEGLEELVLPRILIDGNVLSVGGEPMTREAGDAVYYLANPNRATTSFGVELTEASSFESVFVNPNAGPGSLDYGFGCVRADRTLAMVDDTPSGSDGGRGPWPWVLAGLVVLAGAIGASWTLRSRKAARDELLDPLTGAYNTYIIDRHLRRVLADVGNTGFAVLKVDIDRFREVNRTRGRPAGDAVLRAIAERSSSLLQRPDDAVVRMSGDEFLVVLTGLEDPRVQGAAAASRLLSAMTAPIEIPIYRPSGIEQEDDAPTTDLIVTTITIGVAHCGRPCDVLAMADDADDVLYVAKDQGPGQVRIHPAPTPSLDSAGDPGWQELPSLRTYGRGEAPQPRFIKKEEGDPTQVG